MRASSALLLLAFVAAASAYTWDSCGTQYDRLQTASLTFSASPSLSAGSTATIVTSGKANLHAPLASGAWTVRVYELGQAHSIFTAFGDLVASIHWNDPLDTTYTQTVSYTLPAATATGNFTASLISTDQAQAEYNCLEVHYLY